MVERITQGSRRLGTFLRKLRVERGLLVDDVAEAMRVNKATISRYETGGSKPNWPTAKEIATFLGATESQFERLEQLFEFLQAEPKPMRLPAGVPAAFRRLVNETNGMATQLREISVVVPGLLQTEAYTDALGVPLRDPDADKPRGHGVRAKRQARINPSHPRPLRYIALIDEIALIRLTGGPDVMHPQLAHLVDVALNWDNVTIRVITKEAGAYGAEGGMTLVDYDDEDEPTWAYFESMGDASTVDNVKDVQRFANIFNNAARIASSPDETIEFIRQQMRVLEGNE